MIRNVARGLATGFGTGYLRPAPGTWASAFAVPAAYLIHATLGFPALALAVVALALAGWWAVGVTLAGSGEDPAEIVIDEVAGQWVALLPVSGGLWHAGADPWLFPWPGWVAAFVLFRLFDIWKPGPVGWADRRPGAAGVMLDDLIAGAMAAVGVALLAGIAHGMMRL